MKAPLPRMLLKQVIEQSLIFLKLIINFCSGEHKSHDQLIDSMDKVEKKILLVNLQPLKRKNEICFSAQCCKAYNRIQAPTMVTIIIMQIMITTQLGQFCQHNHLQAKQKGFNEHDYFASYQWLSTFIHK
jgi:hypothetical protein